MDYTGEYYFLNDVVYEFSKDNYIEPDGVQFYEVLRSTKGIPWFFDDHIARLEEGISSRYDLPRNLKERIVRGIHLLTSLELFDEKNIKITVTFINDEYALFISFVESFYPESEMYTRGVKMISHFAERKDPGVKIYNPYLRNSVNERLELTGAYEALLVSGKGIITEGSRSNIFFIDASENVYTSPDYLVLSGVTRKQVKEICIDNNISLTQREIRYSEIARFSSAFITGTSPMILPVKTIDDFDFNIYSSVMRSIAESYKERTALSLNQFRNL